MDTSEEENLVAYGVNTCMGCGLEIVLRRAIEILGKNTIVVIPPGCAAVFSGFGNTTAMRIAGFQGNLENTAAYASGIRTSLDVQGKKDVNVLAFAGDGATVDIGIQSLSGMFERGERVIYICYDNEAYMNTGGQQSGSTPEHAVTTTTPGGKLGLKKDMIAIAQAHRIPYAASASVAYIKDFQMKVKKASEVNGPAYIHVHAPCPTGWGFDPSKTIEIAKKAVLSGAWELCEVANGEKIVHEIPCENKDEVWQEYMKLQKRFRQK